MIINIRPASPTDAAIASELILATMGASGDGIFGLGDHNRARRALAGLFVVPDTRFSYPQAVIAEVEGQAAGILLAFPGRELDRLQSRLLYRMPGVYSPGELLRLAWRALPMIFETEARKDEYYIAHLAVFAQFRGQGIGARLLLLAEEQCRLAGLGKCSLCVNYGNEDARRLYLRMGFRVVEKHDRSPYMARRLGGGGHERMLKDIEGK